MIVNIIQIFMLLTMLPAIDFAILTLRRTDFLSICTRWNWTQQTVTFYLFNLQKLHNNTHSHVDNVDNKNRQHDVKWI